MSARVLGSDVRNSTISGVSVSPGSMKPSSMARMALLNSSRSIIMGTFGKTPHPLQKVEIRWPGGNLIQPQRTGLNSGSTSDFGFRRPWLTDAYVRANLNAQGVKVPKVIQELLPTCFHVVSRTMFWTVVIGMPSLSANILAVTMYGLYSDRMMRTFSSVALAQ